jgi:hypothetical protein
MTAQAFNRQVSGETRSPLGPGGWPLSPYANAQNRPGAVLHANAASPSPSQAIHNGAPGRSRSNRRRTFPPRDSTTLPALSFSPSDPSYSRAYRHDEWEIRATLWPGDDSEVNVDVVSLQTDLADFIYRGPEHVIPKEFGLLKTSKLRWFHLPMNNVRITLAIEIKTNWVSLSGLR